MRMIFSALFIGITLILCLILFSRGKREAQAAHAITTLANTARYCLYALVLMIAAVLVNLGMDRD